MFVMVVYIVWNALPFKILILLGGLQSVNKQYYDAARVDGTSKARIFGRNNGSASFTDDSLCCYHRIHRRFQGIHSIVGIFGETMVGRCRRQHETQMVGYIYNSLSDSKTGTCKCCGTYPVCDNSGCNSHQFAGQQKESFIID